MRAVSLHRDVIVVTSAVLQVNCVIVRGAAVADSESAGGEERAGETFVIDSPGAARTSSMRCRRCSSRRSLPRPSGLLATHGDWDHLLGRLAFPEVALGCAESTAARLRASPGEPQRALRTFDEELMIERPRPLALGSVQALPVPGRCGLGDRELELHAADGHTPDGMAIWIPWARVLVAGDYLSPVEIPGLEQGGGVEAYLTTLERLRPLVAGAEQVVPGHGPVLGRDRATEVLEEDVAYLGALRDSGEDAQLPSGRRSRQQRRLHAENVIASLTS